ncbi:hypothetical protein NECID01_1213 [Nematocida sp. AWRm77]|nr:hypothetical protein NECID01_1213 [Nematocida sp. AWRm77]
MARATVKVAHLDRFITSEILKKYFQPFGEIHKIIMPKKSAPYAQIVFGSTSHAKRAIEELHNTTLHTLRGKIQKIKKCNPHFVWELSLLSTDVLWEEDPRDTTEVEKRIVQKKKRNMSYVDSLSASIELSSTEAQRPVIKRVMPFK